jgi:hypothetical protein
MTQIATFVQQLGPQRCHRTWLAWLGIPEHCRKFLRKSSNYCWGIFQPCFTGGNQVTSWISQRCWEHLRKPPIFGVRTMVSSLDFQLLSSDPHCYHLNPGSSSVFQVPVFVMAATNVYIYIYYVIRVYILLTFLTCHCYWSIPFYIFINFRSMLGHISNLFSGLKHPIFTVVIFFACVMLDHLYNTHTH